MMKLKTGDIVFSTNINSKMSAIFRWFLGSQWSHAFIIVEQTATRTYAIQTTSFEIAVVDFELEYLLNSNEVFEVWSCELPEQERIAAVKKVVSKQLTIYGYLNFISLGIKGLLKKVGINIPVPFMIGPSCFSVLDYAYGGLFQKGMDTQDWYLAVQKNPYFRLNRG
jgi:hypothetical protein